MSRQKVVTRAVVDTQWGDCGKGKVVDIFGEDVVVRGTGGANSGHTLVVNGVTYVLHLTPSGILHPNLTNIIGNGVAFDPRIELEELEMLSKVGVSTANLLIAHNARLVLPGHIALDRARESGNGKIGTTGRGIGPTYEDHVARRGLTVNDMLNPDSFRKKLRGNLEEKIRILRSYDPQVIARIMCDKRMENGAFYDASSIFNTEAIVEFYLEYGRKLSEYIGHTDKIIRGSLGNRGILLEAAQGNMLSIDFGSYPFVTSSDCTIHGLARGAGITAADVDEIICIAKFPYMTRVGDGPFPTEMGGERSAEWCASDGMSKTLEQSHFPEATMKVEVGGYGEEVGSEFELGVAVRMAGDEFGATTKRPRRCGWFDLPLLRYSLRVTGSLEKQRLALTKLDVMNNCPTIRICVAYRYEGPSYRIGRDKLMKGDELRVAIPSDDVMRFCKPVYQDFPGWRCDISSAKKRSDLPRELLNIIDFVERDVQVPVTVLSVGRDREQTILT